jgi:hypothetical protein
MRLTGLSDDPAVGGIFFVGSLAAIRGPLNFYSAK